MPDYNAASESWKWPGYLDVREAILNKPLNFPAITSAGHNVNYSAERVPVGKTELLHSIFTITLPQCMQ